MFIKLQSDYFIIIINLVVCKFKLDVLNTKRRCCTEFTFIFYDFFIFFVSFLYPHRGNSNRNYLQCFSTRAFLAKHPTLVAGNESLQRRDHDTLKGNGWLVDKVNIDTLFK